MNLGVNIDHIAVLREARRINDPDPLMALAICAQNGADQITIHLREDRRHINDDDALKIIKSSPLPVNLECSIDEKIIDIICDLKPFRATLVPEKREEVTTEGGLDLFSNSKRLKNAVNKLQANGIEVSLFIDPTLKSIEESKKLGVEFVELHTGSFANIFAMLNTSLSHSSHSIKELELSKDELKKLLEQSLEHIKISSKKAKELGLNVAAGHGLNYQNIKLITPIKEICELNIGQSIIARSVFTGLANAVKEIKELCKR